MAMRRRGGGAMRDRFRMTAGGGSGATRAMGGGAGAAGGAREASGGLGEGGLGEGGRAGGGRGGTGAAAGPSVPSARPRRAASASRPAGAPGPSVTAIP